MTLVLSLSFLMREPCVFPFSIFPQRNKTPNTMFWLFENTRSAIVHCLIKKIYIRDVKDARNDNEMMLKIKQPRTTAILKARTFVCLSRDIKKQRFVIFSTFLRQSNHFAFFPSHSFHLCLETSNNDNRKLSFFSGTY